MSCVDLATERQGNWCYGEGIGLYSIVWDKCIFASIHILDVRMLIWSKTKEYLSSPGSAHPMVTSIEKEFVRA